MISLSHLNKITQFTFFFTILIFNSALAATAVDIWKKKENQNEQNNQTSEEEVTIQSPIISDDIGETKVRIDEKKIEESNHTVIGLFDPEENDFNLNMWLSSDGEDIKNILKRIDKLKLSQFSEDLLFQVLFTNAYPPKTNLNSLEFLKIKIDWLIKNRRFKDLETLLQTNPNAGKEPKAINLLINQYLSSVDIKSACEKINFVSEEVRNDYLNKFTIYCLINDDRKDEAQLLLELLIESGFSDKFFEDKIGFLLGFKETTNQKIIDNNLLNFYLSHITSNDFNYKPNEKTDKYIWRYLSSANLINSDDIEDENIISTYEKAAANNSFDSEEIFNIYRKILFNVNQLINSTEIYKNLPNYKARALIYQSILLSDNIEKKLYFIFLLKDLFAKDKLLNVYSNELVNILQSIHPDEIPESYNELVKQNIEQNFNTIKNIKFDNDILHRSKVLKHFLEKSQAISKTEKDFKAVYKKIKKNKKYFISIKDIVVLESLAADGILLPNDLNYTELSSQLTIPNNLQDLVSQNQIGLVMLKIIEIIGEDNISDLDPETIYFLNRILNDLNLKKIRNNILSEALPVRV